MILKVKKLHPDAILPKYAHFGDSGMSLHAIDNYVIKYNEITLVKTGIALDIPLNFEVQVRSRSGLALRHGITLVNSIGTIDQCYKGEIMVPMIRLIPGEYQIVQGYNIAQLVLAPVEIAEIKEIVELSNSTRNADGFGSTGK